MIKLSDTLKAKIAERPLQTILRESVQEKSSINYSNEIKKFNIIPNLPENFDGRKVWGEYLSPILNQGKCGSCWAFATTATLADRFNILSQGKIKITLSPTKLIICDWNGTQFIFPHPDAVQVAANIEYLNFISNLGGGCYGNTLLDAWRYIYLLGCTTLECLPYNYDYSRIIADKSEKQQILLGTEPVKPDYTQGNFWSHRADFLNYSLSDFKSGEEKTPLCSDVSGQYGDMCVDFRHSPFTTINSGTPAQFWRSSIYYVVPGTKKFNGSDENIMSEIYQWGPVTSGFNVYPDFYEFNPKTEIYKWDGQGPQVGGHAIEIVGWGEEKGMKYWLIKNSFGKEWGIDGYFKMLRGINMCKIEENVVCGIPDFFNGLLNPNSPEFKKFFHGKMLPAVLAERKTIDYGTFDTPAPISGGIDPKTGYTRRVMNRLTGFNFSAPIHLSQVPNLSKYIAGTQNTNNKLESYNTLSVSATQTDNENNYRNIVFIFTLVFTSLILISFLILNFKNRIDIIKNEL